MRRCLKSPEAARAGGKLLADDTMHDLVSKPKPLALEEDSGDFCQNHPGRHTTRAWEVGNDRIECAVHSRSDRPRSHEWKLSSMKGNNLIQN